MLKYKKIGICILFSLLISSFCFILLNYYILNKQITTLNKSCPIIIDTDFRLNRIKLKNNIVELNVTIINDVSAIVIMSKYDELISKLRYNSCKNEIMKDYGIPMHYTYYSNYAEELFDYTITKDFCNNL